MVTEQKKKEDVYKILKTQIVCKNRKGGIEYDPNSKVIYTGQKYYSKLDEDMSDFSIEFYKIIYKDILYEQMLKKDGTLENQCFAGDTINSFNSIANLIPKVGKTIEERKGTSREEWPKNLTEYVKQYHCLANFWILPLCIGRTGKKLNYYDSMDIFLDKLNKDYKVLEKHSSYFNAFSTFSEFKEKHFITKYNINDINITLSMYKDNKAEELIKQAQKMIDERAKEISDSRYCEELWDYFHSWNLC